MTKWIVFCFGSLCLTLMGCSHQTLLLKNEDLTSMSEDLNETEQLVWVQPPRNGIQTEIQRYERHNGNWHLVPGTWNAVVGKQGLAPLGEKREGDLKTPQGLFTLRRAFGKNSIVNTAFPYEVVTNADKWIDDPQSLDYNKPIRGVTSAKSYEELLRPDELYDLALVLEYNTSKPEPGKGSAIFLHLWRSPNEGTAGCVAVDRTNLENLFQWLNPEKHPKILIGDRNSFLNKTISATIRE